MLPQASCAITFKIAVALVRPHLKSFAMAESGNMEENSLVAQGNIFLCSLRKIQLYLICLDGGVERDCSSLTFPSVWLVPPPEVEGEEPARSSIMVEIAPP